MILKILSQEQKNRKKKRCFNFLELIENEQNFLERVITDDKSWVFEYDPEKKHRSVEWHTSTLFKDQKRKNV